jgi:hypothetical protein
MRNFPVKSLLMALLLATASLPVSAESERYLVQDVVNVQIIGGLRQDRLSSTMDGIGDFNGDGIDDFAVSTNQFVEKPRRNYVCVIHGATDLPKVMDLLNPPPEMLIIENPYTLEVSGLGDFNGDGRNDLAVSWNTKNIGDSGSAGEVLILYGGQITEGVIEFEDDLPGVRIQGHLNAEYFGSVMSRAGDVNGDGYADLLVNGLAKQSLGVQEVVIIYGGTDVPNVLSTGDLGDHGTILKSAFNYDCFGFTMDCVGDVNGDGFDDLLIGADTREDLPDRAYLIYGGTDLPPVIEASSLGKYGMVIEGGVSNLFTADEPAVGDINRDGFDDFVVSKAISSPGGVNRAGEVFVVFGGKNLPQTIDLANFGSRGIRIQGSYENEALAVLTAGPGNWNGDEYADFVLTPGLTHHDVYLFLGGSTYDKPKTLGVDELERAIIHYYDPIGSTFPQGITYIGDINGDGLDDLAVADWFYGISGRDGAGAVYIFYGGQFFPTATATETPTITPTPEDTPTPTPTGTPTETPPPGPEGWIRVY